MVTSAAVPDVVVTAIIGKQGFLVGAKPSRLRTSANSGFVIIVAIALLVSIGLPPPTATITSAPAALQASTLKRRQEQSLRWVRDMIDEHLHNLFFNNVVIQGRMGEVENAVLDGEMSESQAVEELITIFDKSLR